jgi:hypothetical protein
VARGTPQGAAMRCISLWQPHAQAIMLSLKPYETRPWKTDYRGPIAIHAAKKPFRYQDYPLDYYQEVGRQFKHANFPLYALDYGKVICVVDLVDCIPTGQLRGRIGYHEFWGDFRDKGNDGKDRYAFKLENVRVIPAHKRPAVTGRQKWFDVTGIEELIQLGGETK